LEQVDVRLESVTKQFGDVVAVDDLSLDIPRGQFFSLLGPSGCGKTTTLRLIGGFEEPTAGTIYLGDRDITDLPPFRRDVNTVFQSYALFPHLNVFENVAFGLRRKHLPDRDIRQKVGEMLALVQLPGYERRRPRQLSGGQQQRIALARALINRPRVLLLDEPLGALDLKLRKQMQLELKQIQTEVGITFVYVTHDQDEAMTMSDRIAVMRSGRIDQLGTPEELYERPQTEFVAGFLGVSNLLDGQLGQREGTFAEVVLTDGTRLRAPAGSLNGASGDVRVGVRPEKLRLLPSGSQGTAEASAGRNVLAATVVDASYLGVSTQYTVRTADGHVMTVYSQNVETSGRGEALTAGQEIRLTWRPEHSFIVTPADRGEQGQQPQSGRPEEVASTRGEKRDV
jgi:spermidine/putrescine transport system ATP-binding protein